MAVQDPFSAALGLDDLANPFAPQQIGSAPPLDDDFLSVLLNETVPGTGQFEMDEAGVMREVSPEDDYLPSVSSNQHNANLAEDVDEKFLATLASEKLQEIDDDIESRSPWIMRFRRGFEMMGLTPDEVDDGPFPGSSTAVMPVISEAVVQFWARSLAEQVPSNGPTKGSIMGKSNSAQMDRAKRVADYMNHEMMFLDRPWYADHSRMLFALPYTGSCFKKVYRDGALGRNTGVYVQAEDFICNYAFSDLDSAPRYTHRIWRTRNEIRKAQVNGMYRDVKLELSQAEDLPEETEIKIDASDFNSADEGRNTDSRHELYEIYCELDIPGFEDINERTGQSSGIALPYIVTIDRHSEKVLSIYRGWKESDPLKRRRIGFVKYDYLPGPGFYGYGLFHMIGGLQQAATGALRAVIDGAATASLQGGFISKDASMKDQTLTIEPGVWKQVDATSEDLGKAFFTPPFKEPSSVLFQVMGFLVQRAEKFAATTEMQTGAENAKNMPVGSTVAMLEAGGKVFSTIHRGLHKALSEEMRQRYELIQEYMPIEGYPYDVEGAHQGILAEDFAPGVTVVPVSDPNIFSHTQRVALNQAVYDLATQNPDLMKRPVVLRRVLEGLNVPDIDDLMMENTPPAPMDPVSEMQALLRGEPVQAYPDQMHQAYLQHYHAFMNNPEFGGNPQIQAQIGPAAIALLGQRLAYAWAEHAQSLGVPVQMLPPPMAGPEQGLGPPQGSAQGASQPGLPSAQGPQALPQPVSSAEIAQMAAQVAPQMVQVPGLPNPQPANTGPQGMSPEQEAQFKDRETSAKEQEVQAKIGRADAKSNAELQVAATKNAIEAEKLKQHQIDTEVKIGKEMRLAEQDRAQQAAQEQKIIQAAQDNQRATEAHALNVTRQADEMRTQRTMDMIKAAVMSTEAQNNSRETDAKIETQQKKAIQKPAKKTTK